MTVLATCPTDKVGTSDVRWRMIAMFTHRLRSERVANAERVIRSRSKHATVEVKAAARSIIDGPGDLLGQKVAFLNLMLMVGERLEAEW